MKIKRITRHKIAYLNKLQFIQALLFILLFTGVSAIAQGPENPPRPAIVYVSPTQWLNFGAFYQGGFGGSVIIYANGSRSTTGSVIQVNQGYSFSPAIFEIDAEPGTLITILNGPNVTLTGSNGGTIDLTIGESDPPSPFIATATSPSRTMVRIGGTLTLGNPLASPPGNYNGTFSVTFIQP
ncbi:DUF4402 domain-containing protein [Flavobacterium sp. DG1-102-2]|uniref:DUF4402 domain-containing protein n=1 Tax=Flavobacterium sp. DG1-102-2 TaxID=3081663 RepID=UPI002948D19B|nr:DUF4402 domain-containing protein [Flavobacterium sp. DG1-102-2]MDV6166926.1 DUF4402 domain-containing protein [Flavobacterium sp. DG1-102-2]